MIFMINFLLIILFIFISIAFFTLMERKILSYSQNRKGPNKTALMGILQPISDAIKLFTKEISMNLKSNLQIFLMSPITNLVLSLFLWTIYPYTNNFNFIKFSILFFFSISSLNIIVIMMSSWSSNSNYSILGMMRTIAQMISYEISLMILILCIVNFNEQLTFSLMANMQKFIPLMTFNLIIFFIWMISILAETNRTPFDFSEGESELVSGFNIEYSSKSFAFLFLAEYSNILLMSFITPIFFLNYKINNMTFFFFFMVMSIYFIWIRTTLPRFRYDKLMNLTWKKFLPISLINLFVIFSFKLY